jgi:hypothetical protein
MKRWTAVLAVCGVLALGAMAQETGTMQAPEEQWYASLPPGTAVRIKLEHRVSTMTSQAGDSFSGRVTEPVMSAGRTVIPVGASVQGRVMRVSEPRRIAGRPSLDLLPESVTLPNGQKYALFAVIVDTSNHYDVSVDDEGRIKGKGMDGRDRRNIAIGTGAGAGVGVLAGGGKGLLLGSAIGAGASVTHWLIKRRSADLPPGTEVIMELSRPMVMTTDGATGR